MLIQVLNRLAWLLVSLVLASMLVFAVVNVLPGDVAAVILGTSATPQSLETLRHQLGLDQPAWLRYVQWVGGMLRSDFGTSLLSHSDVGPLIVQKLSVSGPWRWRPRSSRSPWRCRSACWRACTIGASQAR